MQPNESTAYKIEGGAPIVGSIRCYGAKNFATKAMIAALLGDAVTKLTNVPPIGDVEITADMLRSLGATIVWDRKNKSMTIDPTSIRAAHIHQPHSGSNRMPILMPGALLHRFDEVSVPFVGGCAIGARGVDFQARVVETRPSTVPGGTVERTTTTRW
ncbi:MAG: UDP-N-acetylglucosamine 1-carboxyvinyltransferase [Bacteroidota bacterium]